MTTLAIPTSAAGRWVVVTVGLLWSACATSAGMRRAPEAEACPVRETATAPGAITWYGPAAPADREQNERWCETVGPAVVRAEPGSSFPNPAGDSLAVVSWNIVIGGGDVPRFLEERLGYGCQPSASRPTAGFQHFVLLVQEAYRRSEAVPDTPESFRFPPRIVPESRPEGWPDIVEVARRCGLALLYVPSQRNGPETVEGGREDKGNAILSTLPFRDPIAIELPFEAGRRVAVGATVSLPGGTRLRVVSAHLDVASTLYRTLTTANTARLRQAIGLLEALALVEDGGVTTGTVPVGTGRVPCHGSAPATASVVAGDWNTWSAGESAIDQLRQCFPDSGPWDGQPTHGPYPTDFIFFRRSADRRISRREGPDERVAEVYGSDHHARIAWLRWSE